MSQTLEQVLQAALALPESERAELVEHVTASLEPEGGPLLDEEWMEEIRRRSREIDAGNLRAQPWETVREQARKRVFGDG